MTSLTLPAGEVNAGVAQAAGVDTVRALCHDLRQPLTAIMLLAATEGGDARRRLATILEQATWLADLVDDVLVDAASDQVADVDVGDLAWGCVLRARPTAGGRVDFVGQEGCVARAQPVALGRALSSLLDNAVHAAGEGGQVVVTVGCDRGEVVLAVEDDGPGLGHVQPRHSLGLRITQALVAACDGRFELSRGPGGGGVVATIRLVAACPGAVAS